jgi:hypothetical protein
MVTTEKMRSKPESSTSRTNGHHRETVYELRMESMYLDGNDFEIGSDPLGIISKINEYQGDTVIDICLRLVYLNDVMRSNRIEVRRYHLDEQRLPQKYTVRTALRTDVSQRQ